MKLLKLQLYRITDLYALNPCAPVARLNFCNWNLQSITFSQLKQSTHKEIQSNNSSLHVLYIQKTIAYMPESV